MDYETVDPADFGRSLKGLGLNLLVRDVGAEARFLQEVFAMTAHRLSERFAIMAYGGQIFQLHADPTFAGHPLLTLLPESGPRGGGVEVRLYDSDPDAAVARASAQSDGLVLAEARDKPHGLREAVILSPAGYAWVPSRAI